MFSHDKPRNPHIASSVHQSINKKMFNISIGNKNYIYNKSQALWNIADL